MEERLGEVSEALAAATHTASQLPGSTDLDFYCSIDGSVQTSLADATDRLGTIMQTMRQWVQESGRATPHMDSAEQIASARTFTAAVGDMVDQLLERTDVYLDEYTGRRTIATTSTQPAASAATDLFKAGPLPPHILNAQIPHPQRLFTTQPDNREDVAWSRPLRLGKPHAQVPLGWRDPSWDIVPHSLVVGPYSVEGDPRLNPYHVEIQAAEVPAAALAPPHPEAPEALDKANPTASTARCPFAWVRTAAELRELLAHLAEERVKEIAVDLEHHNKHSYLGIVCLMQISTRYGDWIVDTLSDEIREHAESLNTVFTDPSKILVLHGADHDVLWLQRDLGVYVTCLFDTFHATNVLSLSVHSLAFLLQRYTEFEADKRFQLADWRIRPLPKEMMYYARSDTHSLLYIYDRLREELLAQGGPQAIRDVFERSKATATKVFAKEPWDEQGDARSGWHTLWLRHGGDLARAAPQPKPVANMGKEERMMRRLHRWRDTVAREEDEGPQYVLGIAALMHLVFRMPTTAEEVKRAVPASAQAVRRRAAELADVIQAEIDAWHADAALRGQPDDEQLEAMLGSTASEDVGEAFVAAAPPSIAEGTPSEPVQAQPSVWDTVKAKANVTKPQLFRGLLTVDGQGTITGRETRKRKSLFELPDNRALPSLTRIRGECTDLLKRLFGGSPSEAPAFVTEGMPTAMEEVPSTTATDAAPSKGSALSDSEDEVVSVKKARWSKEKKRQRKEPAVTAPSAPAPTPAVTPFDYTDTRSVLEKQKTSSDADMLRGGPKKRRGGKPQDTSTFKTPKRKSDLRSGNRSGTL